MRFTRLFSAITLVAAATVLGSCGQSSAPTAASTTDPSAALGPREYTLAPSFISWDRGLVGAPIPTDTKTVLIGGIIPLASYPSFGDPVYTGGPGNWLDINTAPNFSLNPMGWIVSFKLKPSAQFLPEGSYTATIPVMVPAATNNPQMITVSFGCPNQLVVNGPYREGALTDATPRWTKSSTYNTSGNAPFQDWCVNVPAATTVYVWMQGGYPGCIGQTTYGYTLYDAYEYVFTRPGNSYVTQDDDAGCGYDSIVTITNGGSGTQQYVTRATNFSDSYRGTYRIQARTTYPVFTDYYSLRMPGTKKASKGQ